MKVHPGVKAICDGCRVERQKGRIRVIHRRPYRCTRPAPVTSEEN